MLIQQFVGALCTLLIDRAFRLGTSEPHAIGLSFPRRLLARAALLESLQIDQFPHNHPSCRGFGESGQFEEERVRRKAKTRTGHPGRHCQEVLSNCRAIASKNVFRCAKTNIWCCITAAGKVGSQIVSVSRSYDLSLYLVAVNEFTIRTIPGDDGAIIRGVSFCPAAPAGRIPPRKQTQAAPLPPSTWCRAHGPFWRLLQRYHSRFSVRAP